MIGRKLWLALSVIAAGLLGADSALADPTGGVLTSIIVNAGSWLAGSTVLATVVRTVGMSLLAQALNKKPKAQVAGVKTQTSTGGSTPQTFVLGRRATSGQLVMPLDTYGVDGKTPNAFLTYVVALGCIAGHKLSRLVLNDAYVTVDSGLVDIGGAPGIQGHALGGIYAGNAWIRFHDGSQTTADALLDARFNGLERPWTSDMIGKGIPYAVLVFRFNREVLNSPPSIRFELEGIPLYDPRDETQSWEDRLSWLPTQNPVVMIYNLHRGIRLPELAGSPPRYTIYGGEAEAEDLPLDNWFAAMNACDETIALGGGSFEPRFTAGLEVSLADEPADVMEALETACQAQQVEIGGVWKIRVGGPGLPVAFFEDDDILIDSDRSLDMFPGLAETYNGIKASHPLPSALWEMTDAPARYNADWEKADDNRRLIADLSLPAVYSPTQAQRIMKSAIEEERRFRRHALSMGPYGSVLEPLDAIAWYSLSEDYGHLDESGNKVGKIFEITQVNENLRTLNVEIGLRERDSADFSWSVSDKLPWVAAIPGLKLPVAQAVPGFSVSPSLIKDGAGASRRPALMLQWNGSEMPDVRGIMWEIRVQTDGAPTYQLVNAGSIEDVTRNGVIVVEGILPVTVYEARARLIVDRPTTWTGWATSLPTPDLRLGFADLAEPLVTAMETPLDEILKANLQFEAFRQIQEGLNYNGDGQSLQFVAKQALLQSNDAIDRFSLMGILAPDRSAYTLNTSFVKVNQPKAGGGTETVTLAGFVDTTVTTVRGHSASIQAYGESIDGLTARYTIQTKTVGPGGETIAMAGLAFGADQETSVVAIIAENFFIADNSSAAPKKVFGYSGSKITMTADVEIQGNLLVTETVTTQKLIENAVTDFDFDDFPADPGIDAYNDPYVATVNINPGGKRVRIDFGVALDGDGSQYAALIKLYKSGAPDPVIYGYIGNEAFRTQINGVHYDFGGETVNVEWKMRVMAVRGTNVGDGHAAGADPVHATIRGGTFMIEAKKR